MKTGVHAQRDELPNLDGNGAVDAERLDVFVVHAGEDGDTKQQGRGKVKLGGGFPGGDGGGAHHVESAGGVYGQHLRVEADGGADGGGDGVGDVVVFQVEANGDAAFADVADDFRAGGGKEFEADFEGACLIAEAIDQGIGLFDGGYVDGGDDGVAHFDGGQKE